MSFTMQLEEISLKHQSAFLEMVADYQAHDVETYNLLYKRDRPWTPFEFASFVKECEQARMDWRPKAEQISFTRYVLINEAGKILGNGEMRFPLSETIEDSGGNLVFDVPPQQRGQRYGAHVLNRMLFEAVRAGMARVLVTCNESNTHARYAIEMNRGELSAQKNGKAQYWIGLR